MKKCGSGQENRINDRGDPLRWPRDTFYPQKLALTSPTSGGLSVGIVRLRTKGHGVYFFFLVYGLNDEVSIHGKRRDFSRQHHLQTGSASHLTFFLIGYMEIVLGAKATGS
jgi:hypothetical protein